MSASKQQALIGAPVETVWRIVADPTRYPEWAASVVEVSGMPELVEGASFEQTLRTPIGRSTSTFVVEALDEMRHLRMRCTESGMYSSWLLTEAQGETFAEVELGMEPASRRARLFDATLGSGWYRKLVGEMLEGLAGRARAAGAGEG